MYAKNDGCLLGSVQHVLCTCSGILYEHAVFLSGQFVGFRWMLKLCVADNVSLA